MNAKKFLGMAIMLVVLSISACATCQQFSFVIETKQNSSLSPPLYAPSRLFSTTDNVYMFGYNLGDSPLNVYVVADRNWASNDTLPGTPIHVNYANNEFKSLGKFPAGKYDIIVDRNKDGKYDECDAIDSATSFGFEVAPELSTFALFGLGLISVAGIAIRKG